MHDIIRELPSYQEVLKEGREKGFKEGFKIGFKQGQLEALRQTVIDIVAERFPRLLRIARKLVTFTEDLAALRQTIVKLSKAQTAEEAKLYLLEMDEEDEEE